MEAVSQPSPSKEGKEIGAGAASNCSFLRTRETSTNLVGCVCPAWRLRTELIEHSDRQDSTKQRRKRFGLRYKGRCFFFFLSSQGSKRKE